MRSSGPAPTLEARKETLGPVVFDCIDAPSALALMLSSPRDSYRYVVTPNVDHVVRLHANPKLLPYYQSAWLSLNDSRLLQLVLRMFGVQVPVARGSDLASMLLTAIGSTQARVAVLGCEPSVIEELRRKHPRLTILHHNPKMGFYDDPTLVAACVDFVRDAQADYTFFAVGSPQQEMVAYQCFEDGGCRGIGLCFGAALLMYVGHEKRAPMLFRSSGMEWLFRLSQNPQRLWRRYFVRDPIIVFLIAKEMWRRFWRKGSASRAQ